MPPLTLTGALPALTEPAAWQALILAWVATVLAVATALLTAYFQIRKIARDLNGVGAKVDLHARVLVAGGRAPSSPPAWNQLADPNPDGTLPALRTTECGEEVAAMICYWRHQVPIEADYVRFLLRGSAGGALTTGADVARCCALLNVAAISRDPAGWDEARAILRTATTSGRPVAILIRVGGASGYLHWLLAYSSDEREVHANDPWGGIRVIYVWGALQAVWAGQIVEVLSQPDR